MGRTDNCLWSEARIEAVNTSRLMQETQPKYALYECMTWPWLDINLTNKRVFFERNEQNTENLSILEPIIIIGLHWYQTERDKANESGKRGKGNCANKRNKR